MNVSINKENVVRKMGKPLVFVLALCLLLGLFCAPAQAEVYSGNLGTINDQPTVTWRLDTSTGELKIERVEGTTGQITINNTTSDENFWPWSNYRNFIKKITITDKIESYGTRNYSYMFAHCYNLTEVNISGLDTSRVSNIRGMFQFCTNLEEIDLSTFKFNPRSTDNESGRFSDMADLFNGCRSLETVKWNVPAGTPFVTHANGVQIQRMFEGCVSLETVEMTNLTLGHKTNVSQDLGLMDNDTLKTLDFRGTTIYGLNTDNISEVVGFPTKGTFLLEPDDGDPVTGNARQMIDLIMATDYNTQPGQFIPGKYTKISNTSDDFSNVPLTTYLIDLNRERSGQEPAQPKLRIQDPVHGWVNIEMIESDPGRRWTVLVEDDEDCLVDVKTYFLGYPVKLEYGGYIILMDTRSSDEGGRPSLPPRFRVFTEDVNPASGNITMEADGITGKYNKGGDIQIIYPDSAIDMQGSTHDVVVDIDGVSFHNMNKIPSCDSPDYPAGSGIANPWYSFEYIYNIDTDQWGYTDPNNSFVPVRYIDPATGELTLVKEARVYDRLDDGKIPGGYYGDKSFHRYLISAEVGQLNFWNQIKEGDFSYNNLAGADLISKGSGTWIDYTISIAGANPDDTFLYSVDDLDLTSDERWRMDRSDPRADQLIRQYWETNLDGSPGGGEGIILKTGNDLRTVSFADYTGLKLLNSKETPDSGWNGINDYIVGSGYDPETSWSRFYVRSSAAGAKYTWTSGTSCKTTMLKSIDGGQVLPIYLLPIAEKTVNDLVPGDVYNGSFEFTIQPATKDVPTQLDPFDSSIELTNSATGTVVTKQNNGGAVAFGSMSFLWNGKNNQVYVYKIAEKQGSDPNITYNTENVTYYLRVYVVEPDESFEKKGARALVSIGEQTGDGPINWRNNQITVYSSDAQPVYVDQSGQLYYMRNARLNENMYYSAANGTNILLGQDGFNPQITDPQHTKDGCPVYAFDDGQGLPYLFYEKDGSLYKMDDNTPVTNNARVMTGSFNNDVWAIQVTVQKNWDDADNWDGIQPDKVEITLHAGSVDVETVTLSAGNSWTHTFTDLPKYDAVGLITYTVVEKTVDGYSPEYKPAVGVTGASGTIEITNRHTPEVVQISAMKSWDDANNQDGLRRDCTITLKATCDGEDITADIMRITNQAASQTIQANAEGSDLIVTWKNLPKTRKVEGVSMDVTYTVDEDPVPNYSTDYSPDVSITGRSGTVKITNRHTPEVVQITATKSWDDANKQDGVRPESIQLTISGKYTVGSTEKTVTIENPTVTIRPTNDGVWPTYTWKNLPKKQEGQNVTYTVVETAVPDYSTEYYPKVGVTGRSGTIEITNSYTPGKTRVEVVKRWDDANNQDGIRPGHVTVELVADGEDTGKTLELNAENKWTGKFEGLELKKDDKLIVYTVKEVAIENYVSQVVAEDDYDFLIVNEYIPPEPEPEPEPAIPATPNPYVHKFTFTKKWQGDAKDSIDWTFYAPNGAEYPTHFRKEIVSEHEWHYVNWLTSDADFYLVEKVPAGYKVRYENVAPYEDVKDRLYNGGTMINYKVPKTGDDANPALWIALAALGIGGLALLLKKRRASAR